MNPFCPKYLALRKPSHLASGEHAETKLEIRGVASHNFLSKYTHLYKFLALGLEVLETSTILLRLVLS